MFETMSPRIVVVATTVRREGAAAGSTPSSLTAAVSELTAAVVGATSSPSEPHAAKSNRQANVQDRPRFRKVDTGYSFPGENENKYYNHTRRDCNRIATETSDSSLRGGQLGVR